MGIVDCLYHHWKNGDYLGENQVLSENYLDKNYIKSKVNVTQFYDFFLFYISVVPMIHDLMKLGKWTNLIIMESLVCCQLRSLSLPPNVLVKEIWALPTDLKASLNQLKNHLLDVLAVDVHEFLMKYSEKFSNIIGLQLLENLKILEVFKS